MTARTDGTWAVTKSLLHHHLTSAIVAAAVTSVAHWQRYVVDEYIGTYCTMIESLTTTHFSGRNFQVASKVVLLSVHITDMFRNSAGYRLHTRDWLLAHMPTIHMWARCRRVLSTIDVRRRCRWARRGSHFTRYLSSYAMQGLSSPSDPG